MIFNGQGERSFSVQSIEKGKLQMNIDILNAMPSVRLEAEGISVLLSGSRGIYTYNDVEIELSAAKTRLNVFLSADRTPVRFIKLRWKCAATEGLRLLGDAWERGYGDLEWRGVVPERVMPWYMLLSDREGTGGIGAMTGANALCSWRYDGYQAEITLDVRNGAEGVVLSGRKLCLATVVSMAPQKDKTAFEAAQIFCRSLCKEGRLPKSYVYGSNNWYYAYGNSSHRQILRDADLLRELTCGNAVRPYLVIDDGWQVCHAPSYNGGPWNAGNEHFPDMRRLAAEIRERDLNPGIWIRPLVTKEQVPDEYRLQRDKSGDFSVLDPSHPGVLRMVEKMIQTLTDWGYGLIKHDFTTCDLFGRWGMEMGQTLTEEGWHFYDRTKTTAEIVSALYRTIREAAGEETVLIGCNTISHLSAGYFELQRTGDDTSGRRWERTRKMGVNTLAFRMPQHGVFYACDADCVGVTTQIDWRLNREWLHLLSLSGTPLFVSVDPDSVTPEQKREIRGAFQTALTIQKPAQPISWQDTTCPDQWLTQEGTQRFYLPSVTE